MTRPWRREGKVGPYYGGQKENIRRDGRDTGWKKVWEETWEGFILRYQLSAADETVLIIPGRLPRRGYVVSVSTVSYSVYYDNMRHHIDGTPKRLL